MQTANLEPSKKELKQQVFDLTELRRLVWDLQGCQDIPLEEIHAIRDRARHCYDNLDDFYYRDREQQMEAFMKHYAMLHKRWQAEGVVQEPMTHPVKYILNQLRYNCGSGITFLHHKAFMPIMEIMCDDEQARKWIPMCRDLKIFGTYAQTELGHGSDV
jgi:alkylation response protein AidB-like acyl-CoA dehydrogenase